MKIIFTGGSGRFGKKFKKPCYSELKNSNKANEFAKKVLAIDENHQGAKNLLTEQ